MATAVRDREQLVHGALRPTRQHSDEEVVSFVAREYGVKSRHASSPSSGPRFGQGSAGAKPDRAREPATGNEHVQQGEG